MKEGEIYWLKTKRFPDGVRVKVERIAAVQSGAVLAWCKGEAGIHFTVPVSKWECYGVKGEKVVEKQDENI